MRAGMNDPAALQRRAEELGPWFHNVHLPGGVETAPDHPLGDFPRFKWNQIAPHLPTRLQGWRALDIGCNAGYYAVELAARGAEVTAIDHDPHYLDQARWVAELFGVDDRVRLRRMQVYDLARETQRFDLVLFMGLFYHLRYPVLALDTIARLTGRMLVFQTLTIPGGKVAVTPPDFGIDDRSRMSDSGWPHMAFVEERLAGDPTNWWVPNHAAVLALLRSCGMRVLARPGHEIYVCSPDPDVRRVAPDEDEWKSVFRP
jgi:tRNA (mo5U34)-methyltransferase